MLFNFKLGYPTLSKLKKLVGLHLTYGDSSLSGRAPPFSPNITTFIYCCVGLFYKYVKTTLLMEGERGLLIHYIKCNCTGFDFLYSQKSDTVYDNFTVVTS